MEQINSSAVRNSIFALIQTDVPQGTRSLEKKEHNKNTQVIDSNTGFNKKVGDSLKNSRNLYGRNTGSVIDPCENSENCNKFEAKSNEPELEGKRNIEK